MVVLSIRSVAHRDIVKETRTTRKSRTAEPACRLFGLVARQARKVVVFRRGPSKRCCLILWDLVTDQFEIGQWIKTRVREQWSDVSPDAAYLIYVADDYGKDWSENWNNAYTAISIPPYFTALAFWPELFVGRWLTNILLVCNGGSTPTYNRLPAHVAVRGMKAHEAELLGHPSYRTRLLRDGWMQRPRPLIPASLKGRKRTGYGQNFDPAVIVFKQSDTGLVIEDRLLGRGPDGHPGPGEKIEIAILKPDGTTAFTFSDADWADFDNNSDLLFGRSGCLYRLEADRIAEQSDAASAIGAAKCLIDLSKLRFEAKRAPYADTAGP